MLGEVLGGVSLLGFGGAGGGIEVCGVGDSTLKGGVSVRGGEGQVRQKGLPCLRDRFGAGKALWPSKGLSGEALEGF
jgi:hypothetical protein